MLEMCSCHELHRFGGTLPAIYAVVGKQAIYVLPYIVFDDEVRPDL